MAPQCPVIMEEEDVTYQSDLHHTQDVYFDVPVDDLPYLGIFPDGINPLGPLEEPEELWLADSGEFLIILE
jgi:hypothetical protein